MISNYALRGSSAAYAAVAAIATFVMLPLTVVFFQPTEFEFSGRDLSLIGLVIAVVLSAALGILAFILPEKIHVPLQMLAKAVLIYVVFFCFAFPVQSGEDLGPATAVVGAGIRAELLIHALVFLGILLALFYSKEVMASVAFASAAVTLGASAYFFYASLPWKLPEMREHQAKLEDFASLSGQRNVLVVLLDELRGKLVFDTLEQEPALKQHFLGFTFFTEATSASPRTAMSLPNILSGGFYPGGDAQVWMDKATATDGFLVDAVNAGFDPRYLQTMVAPCGAVSCVPATSFSGESVWGQLSQEYVKVFRLGLMRVLPVAMHGDISLPSMSALAAQIFPVRGRQGGSMTEPEQYLTSYQRFTNALSVSDSIPARLAFGHFTFTHLPLDFDRNCKFDAALSSSILLADVMQEVRCGVDQLVSLNRKLKELGVYDNTAILYISDHGENTLYYHSALRPDQMAFVPGEEEHYHPTIMFKPFGAGEPLRYSVAPAALMDVRKTICNLMPNCDAAGIAGEDLATLAEDTDRVRTIMHFRYGTGLADQTTGAYPPDSYRFVEFRGRFSNLAPAIFNPHSYRVGDVIDFTAGGNSIGYTFTGWSMPQKNGTFSDARSGASAVVELKISDSRYSPLELTAPLKLTAEVEAYTQVQKVDVIANGIVVATWEIKAGGETEIMTAEIPAFVAGGSSPLQLAFRSHTPVRPADLSDKTKDMRELGLLMINLKLDYTSAD